MDSVEVEVVVGVEVGVEVVVVIGLLDSYKGMKKQVNLSENAWVKEMNNAMKLLKVLKDGDSFKKLTMKEKLEALRLGVIQEL